MIMDWLTLWWVWIGFALILAIIEILLPSFIFLGFAIGAAAMAVLVGLLGTPMAQMSFNAMMAIFAGLSLVGWIALRFAFKGKTAGAQTFTEDVND